MYFISNYLVYFKVLCNFPCTKIIFRSIPSECKLSFVNFKKTSLLQYYFSNFNAERAWKTHTYFYRKTVLLCPVRKLGRADTIAGAYTVDNALAPLPLMSKGEHTKGICVFCLLVSVNLPERVLRRQKPYHE